MYSHIKGIVDSVLSDRAVLEASGVGYEVFCSSNTLKNLKVGVVAKLLIHFNLSQDAVALYGFSTEGEKSMFRKLISVTRIGPKVALNVLSVLSPEDVALAVVTDNPAAFDRVSGMGRKTASRVILELKEKVGSIETGVTASVSSESSSSVMRSEATSALISLGYDGMIAGRAVAAVSDCERVEDMITLALRELSKQ